MLKIILEKPKLKYIYESNEEVEFYIELDLSSKFKKKKQTWIHKEVGFARKSQNQSSPHI